MFYLYPQNSLSSEPQFDSTSQNLLFSRKTRVLSSSFEGKDGLYSAYCFCKTNSEVENVSLQIREETEIKAETKRPPFNINLAVILAGFAFEAYTTPLKIEGKEKKRQVRNNGTSEEQ
ncbi:hypothetical protein ACSBR2_016605 [Camellia fascicularis]